MRTDVQVGGTEQLFNLMAGRKLQEQSGQQAPDRAHPADPGRHRRSFAHVQDDRQLLSASTSRRETMYGKVMSIPDEAMLNFYTAGHAFWPG